MTEQPFAGAIKPGTQLGKYQVQDQLAIGGMAIIYKAYDPSLARPVAIKHIAPHLARDPRFVERFRAEAQTLARLSTTQANIVSVYELLERDSQLFLVMEYVEGTTLRAMMDRGAVPLQSGLGVLLSTALALKAMHAAGIVHRDLTPSNIMMARDGALKVTDFGLVGHSGGRTSLPMGTTKYMAPEMFTGAPVDPRADIYSLGFIAYEMLLGPEKFAEAFVDVLRDEKAQQVRWMHWHANATLKAPALKDIQPGIPPLISKIVERMVEKDLSRRFASADQIIRWLRRIFVMNVKGQGLTQADSQDLEKEMEADAGSAAAAPAVVRARPAASVPAAAPAAVPAVTPGVEKTAPLSVSKWTWKRAAIWGGILAGAMIAVSVGGVIAYNHWQAGKVRVAQEALHLADQFYEQGRWADAAAEYAKVGRAFAHIEKVAQHAHRAYWMAQAEKFMAQKNWIEADAAMQKADVAGAERNWVGAFQERLSEGRDIEERMTLVKQDEEAGKYLAAAERLRDLMRKHGDKLQAYYGIDAGARIGEDMDRQSMKEYRDFIFQGKEARDKGDLDGALLAYRQAQRIRETPEVLDLIRQVTEAKDYQNLFTQAEKAFAESKWEQADDLYTRALQIKPSETVKLKRDQARAEALATKARALKAAGLADKANEIWPQVLLINSQHAEALKEVQSFKQADLLRGLIKAGDDAMGQKNWDEAIRSFAAAVKVMDKTSPEFARITGQSTEARYQIHAEKAKDLADRRDWDGALAEIGLARGVRDNPELKALEDRIGKLRQYYLHFDAAKQYLSDSSFVKALAEFENAAKVSDTSEVRDLITETNYRRYLSQGKAYLEQKEATKALAYLKLARDQKKTPEVDAWIDQAERLLGQGGKP